MAIMDHLLGDPDTLDGPGLARGVRRGSEEFAVRCIRALGERDEPRAAAFLAPHLTAGAAVRRAAARALGHLARPESLVHLRAAWTVERSEEGRVALAVARVRCGDDPAAVLAALTTFDARTLHTVGGPRTPGAVAGVPPLIDRLQLCLGARGGEILSRTALLTAGRAAVAGGVGGTAAQEQLQALAAQGHPGDLTVLQGLFRSAGRRGEHALVAALGLSGDPRAAITLRDFLRATDVDPGRGFAQRRLAATALGRLGLRRATPWLLRALADEAADHEGRPGAGLGIQYPVRTNLLWALGEVGDPAALPTLATYLGNTHGSALGGFYLPAMDALAKYGPEASPVLHQVATRGPEIAAAHAVSVLAAGGVDVHPWVDDPRPPVRALARRVLAS
jgi:hypothetical protein